MQRIQCLCHVAQARHASPLSGAVGQRNVDLVLGARDVTHAIDAHVMFPEKGGHPTLLQGLNNDALDSQCRQE